MATTSTWMKRRRARRFWDESSNFILTRFRCHKRQKSTSDQRRHFLCILWLISFLAFRLSVARRDAESRTAVVEPSAPRRERPACKAPGYRPRSWLLIYKTSSAQTGRRGDIPTRGARKHKSPSPSTNQPPAPESVTTGFQDLRALRRNR